MRQLSNARNFLSADSKYTFCVKQVLLKQVASIKRLCLTKARNVVIIAKQLSVKLVFFPFTRTTAISLNNEKLFVHSFWYA
jgi:hypothetical protein